MNHKNVLLEKDKLAAELRADMIKQGIKVGN
jgi:hypothetical protein